MRRLSLPERNLRMKLKFVTLGLISTLTLILSACGPANPDTRPEDSKLRDGISLLIKDLEANHPENKNWNDALVHQQLNRPLPKGIATPAGWKLVWPNAKSQELPYVYIPWALLSSYPNHFASDNALYGKSLSNGNGSNVPTTVIKDLTAQLNGNDEYFTAIVDVRYSTKDKSWIVFTSVPYLPVTDNAYGWASAASGNWKVIDFGTALVGCGKVPDQVQAEFGFTCPNH